MLYNTLLLFPPFQPGGRKDFFFYHAHYERGVLRQGDPGVSDGHEVGHLLTEAIPLHGHLLLQDLLGVGLLVHHVHDPSHQTPSRSLYGAQNQGNPPRLVYLEWALNQGRNILVYSI